MNRIDDRPDLVEPQLPRGRPASSPDTEFRQLYSEHARTIHRYLARRLGIELADDLTAETFLTALRRWPSYRAEQGQPIAWLYGIATNLARNHRRREQAELLAVRRLQSLTADVPDPAERVVARVDAGVRAGQLAAAVATLKPGDRDALLLLAWTELSYEQIGQALDIPTGTVRSRIHRARRQLQAACPFYQPEQEETS